MKIYSWNMLYRNKKLDYAFEFVAKSDFDIFCLQEVPENFLQRLQILPYHIAYRIDVERLLPNSLVRNYIVTLSKHSFEKQGEIPFDEYWHQLPLRTKLFIHLMPSRFFSKIRNRGGLFVDVMHNGQSVRIFNLHLILAQPAWRLAEFERAMLERDSSQPTIVCGDFNTIEAPPMSILNWILGGKVSDALFHRQERTYIEKCFIEHKLTNALRDEITHSFSRSQLDHILVSHNFSIKNAEVLPDSIGSDHHPIRVEVS